MASAFAPHTLHFVPRPLAVPTTCKPLKTLAVAPSLSIRQSPSVRRALVLFSSSSHQFPRRCSPAATKVAETDPKTVNGGERNQAWEDENNSEANADVPAMKGLIEAYKMAILDRNKKLIDEMEAAICDVENVKNELSAKFAEMKAEITSGKDKFLRINADFENFRKKIEKDRLNFTSDIQVEVLESLLPIVDGFEKAKQQILPNTDKEGTISSSYQGIYKQFVEILRSLGVGVVETVGKPFDPQIHEVVAREESLQFNAGIISNEVCRGFVLRDRVLRPATVKVSTGPAAQAKKSNSDPEKPVEQQPEVASDAVENPTNTTNNS